MVHINWGFKYAAFVFLCFCLLSSNAQMTQKEFVKTVHDCLTDSTFSEGKVRTWVKASNTIFMYNLHRKDSVFSTFEKQFSDSMMPFITSKYKTEISVGMGIYIRELDLLIGGTPRKEIDYYVLE